MRVVFRVDASIQIGTGHVMRCIALAGYLRESESDVVFICRTHDGHLCEYISRLGFRVIPLSRTEKSGKVHQSGELFHAKWLGVTQEEDCQQSIDAIQQVGLVEWLIIDHYAIDFHWEKKARMHVTKIMVIDDLADRMHDCDLLLDQNLYSNMEQRYVELVPTACRQLLGPTYALLRPDFRKARMNIRKRGETVKRILVFFGGTDPQNMTSKTLEALIILGLEDLCVDVVIGSNNPNEKYIRRLCKRITISRLYIQVENMASLMAEADLAVGGGGSATWERCCMGLPSLTIAIAKNQEELLSTAADAGLVYSPKVTGEFISVLSNHLRCLIDNHSLRHCLSVNATKTVDGEGVRRVANALMVNEVFVKLATSEDGKSIFAWRNHESVRRNSGNQALLEWCEHDRWYKNAVLASDKDILIGYVNGKPVGVLRFEYACKEAEVSIYLIPGNYGKGLGKPLLTACEEWLKRSKPYITTLVATVMANNKASHQLFSDCRFSIKSMTYIKEVP